ncbi:hypothetical protein E1B22_07350 [Thermaerobacter sp. FW80]|nr:hypothetical protein E1B22_07350 [Thermaerobacter sp. FW80]
MERKLRTRRVQAIDAQRSQTVEPGFGQIKTVGGADRFLRRGPTGDRSHWSCSFGPGPPSCRNSAWGQTAASMTPTGAGSTRSNWQTHSRL